MDLKSLLKKVLDNLGFLNDQEKLSLTNVAVIIFVSITAFRALFAGLNLHVGDINWTVQSIDIAGTLPLLFSLLNYAHKREANGNNQTSNQENSNA